MDKGEDIVHGKDERWDSHRRPESCGHRGVSDQGSGSDQGCSDVDARND